jgi:hypothetical protein
MHHSLDPHQVTSLLNGTASQWMTGEQVARCQALLGENSRVRVQTVRTLNPTTYLPEEEGEPLHSCEEILDKVFSSRPDLMDTAIPNAGLELFTDGSQSLQEGSRVCSDYCHTSSGTWTAARPLISPMSRVLCPHQGPHPSRWKDSQHLH